MRLRPRCDEGPARTQRPPRRHRRPSDRARSLPPRETPDRLPCQRSRCPPIRTYRMSHLPPTQIRPTQEFFSSTARLHPWVALPIAGSIAADRARCTHDAPRRRTSARASAQHRDAIEGWSISLGDFLEHLDIQRLIAADLLESTVLFFKLLESPGFLAVDPTVLAAPA